MNVRSVFLVALLCAASPVGAQVVFGALQQDARPNVAGLQIRAMGEAVGAVPMDETVQFYNPAHLARLDLSHPRITFVGVDISASNEIWQEYRYIRDDLEPAIDEGLNEIRRTDYDRLEALYEEALELGRTQTTATTTAYGPAVQLAISENEALAVGLYATNTFRTQFVDAGVGIPRLDAYDQLDFILPVTGAFGIPDSPLAVGVTASYTQRYLTAKGALLEELDPEEEHLYVLKGSSLALDAGLHAQDVMPNVDLGFTVYQLLGGGFDYRYHSRIDVTGNGGPDDEAEIAELEARFNQRTSKPSIRLGAAYRVPLPPAALAVLNKATISVDYVSMSSSEYDQPAGAHFRMGVGAEIANVLHVHSGYSQGYPSFGASVQLPVVEIEYAYYGVEDGRTPGQLGRYNHQIQLRFGIF